MWVEVEEGLSALVAEEVVRARRSTAGDADAVWKLEGGGQGGMVDWCDAVDSKTDAEKDQGGLEGFGCIGGGGCEERVGVDVAIIGADVDAEV